MAFHITRSRNQWKKIVICLAFLQPVKARDDPLGPFLLSYVLRLRPRHVPLSIQRMQGVRIHLHKRVLGPSLCSIPLFVFVASVQGVLPYGELAVAPNFY